MCSRVLPLRSQVDSLEQDVLEVLSLVLFAKNTFAPINRLPLDVFSLFPYHCDDDKSLITMTHVCRSWREILVSRSSLWTTFECADVEKTRTYLERSGTCPFEVYLKKGRYLTNAFRLMVPHLYRLRTLSASSTTLKFIKCLNSPAPLLKKLELTSTSDKFPVIKATMFGGNFASLHELRFSGVIPGLA